MTQAKNIACPAAPKGFLCSYRLGERGCPRCQAHRRARSAAWDACQRGTEGGDGEMKPARSGEMGTVICCDPLLAQPCNCRGWLGGESLPGSSAACVGPPSHRKAPDQAFR